ncbi:hypothetical protein BV22DRAFT_1132114 [Leucogyrophana mollusca]|uniref:Uncharacterized protein n=1 Tax=Leucogyrophana mollusca TaxID=85980 RepID=A0ACB8BA48_9AGAM|nr:hypothetical protein BV22DRAFT_1132114 [Leucogyrophana mollusca]
MSAADAIISSTSSQNPFEKYQIEEEAELEVGDAAEEPDVKDVASEEDSDDDNIEQEYNIYGEGGYLPSFHRHLAATQAHLAGSILPSVQLEDAATGKPLQRSSVWRSSTTTWSQSEQNLFFRGLAVHSRWRPDLISGVVRTKNVAEVCEYLSVLEESARALEEDGGDAGGGVIHEAAIEMSDEWVEVEELMAAEVAGHEDEWARARIEDARGEAVKRKRKEMFSSKAKKRKTEQSEEVVMSADERERLKARFKEWKASERFQWDREDLLARLEAVHLQVLDTILREGLERRADEEDDEEDASTSQGGGRKIDAMTPSLDRMNVISDNMIDPALLALSGNAPSTTIELDTSDAVLPTTSTSYLSLASTTLVEPTRAPSLPVAPSEDALNSGNVDVATMSPTSRRRYQKRLYMRRKRAQQNGEAVVTDITRMKPGRKDRRAKEKTRDSGEVVDTQSHTPPEPASMPASLSLPPVDAEEPEEGENKPAPRQKVRGKTRFYKIKAEFETAGINAGWLREHSMDLLHPSALGKLMGVYRSIEDVSDDSTTSFASADLLQYLQACVVAFLTDVMHHVIVSREQEGKLKARSKVWRSALDQIAPAAIEQAVKTVSGKSADRKAHFARLFAHHGVPPSINTGKGKGTATDGFDGDLEQGNDKDQDNMFPLPSLPAYREIHAPIVRPPAAFSADLGFIDTLALSYMKEARRSRIARFSPPKEAEESMDLLPVETDEDAILAELAEEDGVDESDRRAEQAYEGHLWGEVKGTHGTLADE